VHVEAIQRIGYQGVLLSGIAIVAALWLAAAHRANAIVTVAILALYAIALGASETALVFPGLWILLALLCGRSLNLRERMRQTVCDYRFWGLIVLTASYLLYCRFATGRWFPFGATDYLRNSLAFAPAHARVLTAIDVIRRYLVLLVWPFRLSPDYSSGAVPLISGIGSPRLYMSAAVIVAMSAAAFLVARRRPVYLFAWLFFLIAVSVVSNLWFPIDTTMSEALLYVPSLGICWALAQLCKDLGWIPSGARQSGESKLRIFKPLVIVVVCVVVPWAAKTYVRNSEWSDDYTLYRAAVRTTPRSARSHFILGEIYFSEADLLGAEREYYRALEVYPGYTEAAQKLATTRQLLYQR
jgi:hypothetical protein